MITIAEEFTIAEATERIQELVRLAVIRGMRLIFWSGVGCSDKRAVSGHLTEDAPPMVAQNPTPVSFSSVTESPTRTIDHEPQRPSSILKRL